MYLSLNICTYSECISFEMTTKFQIKYILEEEIDPSSTPPPPPPPPPPPNGICL